MKLQRKYDGNKKIYAWLLIAAMLVQSLAGNSVTAFADTVSERTHIESTDLNISQSWSLDCDGYEITCNMVDGRTDRNQSMTLMLLAENEKNYNNYLSKISGRITSHVGSVTLDLNAVAEGTYKLVLWEQFSGGKSNYLLGSYGVEISAEGVSFTDSPYGLQEEKFLDEVNTLDAAKYAAIPYTYYDTISNLEEITEKANSLTADCSTQTEEVEAIYNWIGNTIVYDSEALENGDTKNSANPEWVFENQRATCTGFAELFQIMVSSLGIPCICVSGVASSYDVVASPVGHKWNLVYLDNMWHIVDTTWSTPNNYYGEGNEKNILGNLAYQNYLGILPMEFGKTHYSKMTEAVPGAEKIVLVKQPSVTEFAYGDKFSFDGSVQLISLDGSKHQIDTDKLQITGYDLENEGTQTVDISLGNLHVQYQIFVKTPKTEEVGIKNIEFKTKPQTIEFEQGDDFIFDGQVQYIDENDTVHVIDDEDEKLVISGYDMSMLGKQKITVSYGEYELTYEITVKEPDLTGINMTGAEVEAYTGTQFRIPITLNNNTGIMGLGVDVEYNPDIFECPQVTRGTVIADGTFNDSIVESTNGSFKILWSGTDNMAENGELFSLSFNVRENAKPGKYCIKLSNRQGDTFDEAYNDVVIKNANVYVIVTDKKAVEEELKKEIATASTELESYVDLSLYDDTQKAKVLQIITKAKEELAKATTKAEVEEIVSKAHTDIDAVAKTSISDKPSKPEQPSAPEQPSTPEQPSVPDASDTSNQPAAPGQTSKPSIPGGVLKNYPEPVGTVILNDSAYYRVTAADYYGDKEVEYVKPLNKNKTSVTVPYSIQAGGVTYEVTSVAANAFKNNKKIKKVDIYYVRKIGKNAFQGCTSLKKVDCRCVRTIGDSAFSGCTKLKNLSDLFYVKTIGKNAFYNCKKITSISVSSKKLKSVGKKAFYNINKKATIYLSKKSYLKKCKKAAPKYVHFFVF